jgi:prophage maintenance system killer protein
MITKQSFVAGNKRVAYFAIKMLLRLNGYQFQVEARTNPAFMMNLLDKLFQIDIYNEERIKSALNSIVTRLIRLH